MTDKFRALSGVAAAVLAAVAITSCTSGSAGAPSTGTTGTTGPAPSAVASSTEPTPEQDATLRAEKVLQTYYRDATSCMADPPNTPVTCFDATTIAGERTRRLNALTAAQVAGHRTVGQVDLVAATPVKVDLSNDQKQTPPVVPTVEFSVCYDVSKVDVLDQAGKSVVPSTRASRGVSQVWVTNYGYPDVNGWRVAVVRTEGTPC